MRLLSAFCGGKALNENVKHFVFDLTFVISHHRHDDDDDFIVTDDVIGDPEVIKICFLPTSFPGLSNGL